MKPLIGPKDYYDAATFAAERESVFLRNWFFAGTTQQLPHHDDFRRIEVAGISIVLQNFHGEIKAFNNVCTHRFARLQSEPAGNRQLVCPYHGWRFNGEGLPYAIPRKPLIADVTPETLCQYRLSRWHVRTVGPLIFIKKEQAGETLANDDLERQFGEFAEPLARYAAACGELVENTEYVVKANWKLVVENTLEGYHVDFVHPNTIRKLGMTGLVKDTKADAEPAAEAADPASGKGSYFTFSGQNSTVTSSLNPEVSARMDRNYKFLANRPAKIDGYRHFYFFP
ncbi:MAG: Rieske 2Fe-2S domain-containing protein, partial [Chthoniobacteraceae bacterium]